MPRLKTVFRCADCGGASPKWVGRCPSCLAWNTLVEEPDEVEAAVASPRSADPPSPIAEVDLDAWFPVSTGLPELDRVLGGGLVPGSVTLLGGEPGIGKSTILLQALSSMAGRGATALYVSAEESRQQVRLRAERLGTLRPRLWLGSDVSLTDLIAALDDVTPDVVVVDSIQTVHDPLLASAPGSVAQVRACAARLVHEAKARGVATVLVGHTTKDGGLAGPRVLEHVVDTVLSFEGDRHHALRLLRAVKHRFGSTDELGVFEMTAAGLVAVADPSALFLADRRPGVCGSAVVPTIEGRRPMLVEVQALTTASTLAAPRRSTQGIDGNRLAMTLAVLTERLGLPLQRRDVYALVVGGVELDDPGADLGVALAVVSSLTGVALGPGVVACGEIGLGGELRQVHQCERRFGEAARLGFGRAIVPTLAPAGPDALPLARAATLADAVVLAGLCPVRPGPTGPDRTGPDPR